MSVLLQQLRAESAAIEQFIAVLGQEEQAMVGGRFSELPAITSRKAEMQKRVTELDHQRRVDGLHRVSAPRMSGDPDP